MEIYTDGSSLGNNSKKDTPGGWGFVVVNGDEELFSSSGGCAKATNNVMELQAMIETLLYVKMNRIGKCIIYTDSNYVNMGLNNWSKKWVKNGFKTSSGEPVKNSGQWIDLITLKNNVSSDIEVRWIKAHSVSKWNNRADILARTAAENMKHT